MIIAYRSWRIRPDFLLVGSWQFTPWLSNTQKSKCINGGFYHIDPKVPDKNCTCGTYAYKEPSLYDCDNGYLGIIGTVTLWGKIIEHELGYRAENVQIDSLFYPYHWDENLTINASDRTIHLGNEKETTRDEIVTRLKNYYNVPIINQQIKYKTMHYSWGDEHNSFGTPKWGLNEI